MRGRKTRLVVLVTLGAFLSCSEGPSGGDAGLDGDVEPDSDCPTGCAIDGDCIESDAVNPLNPCERCLPEQSSDSWSNDNGASCDDGLFCTEGDVCDGGVCAGVTMNCSDGVACNGLERCDEAAGSCVDGESPCTEDELCDAESDSCVTTCEGCLIGGTCHAAGTFHPSNGCRFCDPMADSNAWSDNDGELCDDGLFCNGSDSCLGGGCRSHDGDPCFEAGELCLEEEARCCATEDTRGCTDDGDVIWFDSCGRPQEDVLLEDCPDLHSSCVDGACRCDEGWSGDECDACFIFVDGEDGDDENVGTSWTEAVATIDAAFRAARAEGCEVWVAAGTYRPSDEVGRSATFQLWSGVSLYGGFAGTETSREDRDVEVNVTILSGDIGVEGDASDNSYHVVTGADDALIDGFVITGGNADGEAADSRGGGMLNSSVSPTVVNCTFRENNASSGGGMFNVGSAPSVTSCLFENNNADFGAGMHNDGASTAVRDCVFRLNTANERGGGMRNLDANPSVRGCDFEDNTAIFGAGMANGGAAPVVVDSRFIGNDASGDGGGMYNNGYAYPALGLCTFRENTAGETGGAIFNYHSFPNISSCSITLNTSGGDGGGMASHYNTIAWVASSLFADNIAGDDGGGMSNNDGDAVVTSSTFANNVANDDGGGIYVTSADVGVTTSIFWGNTSSSSVLSTAQIYGSGATVTMSDVEGDFTGDGNFALDPLFAVGSYDLTPASPCVGLGDPYALNVDLTDMDDDGDFREAIPFDVGGRPRVIDTHLDLGAYELQADSRAPLLDTVGTEGSNTVLVTFDEPMDSVSATTIGNYAIDGGVTVTGASMRTFANKVALTTTGMASCSSYTLTVDGVTDILGNPVAAGTSMEFSSFSDVLSDNFDDGNYTGWSVLDEAGASASDWVPVDGRVLQDSNTYHWAWLAPEGRRGSILYWDDVDAFSWTDYDFSATMWSSDNDGIGLAFRFQDEDNHYRLDMDQDNYFRSLVRVRGGVWSTLAYVPGGYVEEQTAHLQVSVRGGEIRIFMDEALVFGEPIVDPDPIPSGTVGFYTWASHGATFDDALVHAACL